jgi:hypothetical protein
MRLGGDGIDDEDHQEIRRRKCVDQKMAQRHDSVESSGPSRRRPMGQKGDDTYLVVLVVLRWCCRWQLQKSMRIDSSCEARRKKICGRPKSAPTDRPSLHAATTLGNHHNEITRGRECYSFFVRSSALPLSASREVKASRSIGVGNRERPRQGVSS